MKTAFKIFSLAAASALLMTGCIEETFPENGTATSELVGASSSALESALDGIAPQMSSTYYVYGSQVHETDLGYVLFMIADTEMTGDMYPLGSNSGYDWFRNYNTFAAVGGNTYFSYLPWFTLYRFVKAANDVIAAVDLDNPELTDAIKGMAGCAYAYRALDYYTLMTHFEAKTNVYTDCSKVAGLTIPIVTENTTADDAKNNPRVPHDEMVAFILSDLDTAEQCLLHYQPSSKLLPSLAVVYGLKARVYMWDEDFPNAAKYARLAIDVSGCTPLTKAELVDLNTGFNTVNHAWMWHLHYSAENMGNLGNFTGWMSGEADWGYSSLTMPSIDRALYDRMSKTDYRKPQFLDPDKFDFYPYETCRTAQWIEDAPAYLSLKFRCLNGDFETYSVGGAVDVPMMRVEEMYLIEAEAIGMSQGVSAGVTALNNFMKQHRDPSYNFSTSDARTFQLEVYTQMRLEFWGEGIGFATAKRLQPGVMQNYAGTNAPADIFKLNCKGMKPHWNLVIPDYETQSNVILQTTNNPDPSSTAVGVVGPSPVGQYAPGKYE